ncbi:unnamed protein product [Amoebophrya sp. A120]|nr:unnamed protein product [Amoebophrya sp. A120]|eukprot:GSA120T00025386001.1
MLSLKRPFRNIEPMRRHVALCASHTTTIAGPGTPDGRLAFTLQRRTHVAASRASNMRNLHGYRLRPCRFFVNSCYRRNVVPKGGGPLPCATRRASSSSSRTFSSTASDAATSGSSAAGATTSSSTQSASPTGPSTSTSSSSSNNTAKSLAATLALGMGLAYFTYDKIVDSNYEKLKTALEQPKYVFDWDPTRWSVPNDEELVLDIGRKEIILVRHGQYHTRALQDDGRTLTKLGEEQARLTGERLFDLLSADGLFPIRRPNCTIKCFQSSLTRATQTADIATRVMNEKMGNLVEKLMQHQKIVANREQNHDGNNRSGGGGGLHTLLNNGSSAAARNNSPGSNEDSSELSAEAAEVADSLRLSAETNADIAEGLPCIPDPDPQHGKRSTTNKTSQDRIRGAFNQIFRVPQGTNIEHISTNIYFCHANVIRYFVLRALQLDERAWLRLSVAHASVVWISLDHDGYVSVRLLGDAGHLPVQKLTY